MEMIANIENDRQKPTILYMDRTIDERYSDPDRFSPLDGFDKLSLTDDQIKEEQSLFIENNRRNFNVKSEYIDKAITIEDYDELCNFYETLKDNNDNSNIDKSILREINKIIELRWYEQYSAYWYKNNFKFDKGLYSNENC